MQSCYTISGILVEYASGGIEMSDLEEGSKDGQNYWERELLYSIAISLKRIADAMDILNEDDGFPDPEKN